MTDRARNTCMTDKKAQRKIVKERLAALTEAEKRSFGQRIAEAAIADETFFRAKRVFVFCSMADEPDTSPIIAAALSLGKEVFLPRIEGDEMFLIPYDKDSEMRSNRYGIEEPQGAPYLGKVDLAFVPLLGFDGSRRRLGRGKGYYDRFLSSFEGISVALAFSAQELSEIEFDPWDKKPDRILTEKGRI